MEEEAGDVTEGSGTNETRRSEEDKISDQVREGVGKAPLPVQARGLEAKATSIWET